MTTTVILGGGMGGIATARALRAAVPRDHRVVLIDRTESFGVGAAQTWVMLGDMAERDAVSSRAPLEAHGIEVMRANVLEIDPERRTVRTSTRVLEADHLVVALGAELELRSVDGLSDAAETFFTLEGAARLRAKLEAFTSGDVVVLIPQAPFKCPPAPYEAALLLHDYFQRRGRKGVRVSVHSIEPAPMPTAGPEIGRFVRGALEHAGVEYRPMRKTLRVDPARRVVQFEDGRDTSYDLLIAVPPHRAPEVVRKSALAGPNGWIPVEASTLATRWENVWAIGDVSVVPLPGKFAPDKPLVLPKAGVFAERHGRAVAMQIAARERSGTSAAAFDGTGFCFIEVGGGRAVRGDGEFFATPAPRMAATEPNASFVTEKRMWAQQWLAFEPPSMRGAP